MKSGDLIPEKDELFNVFQRNLVAQVVKHSVAWNIPAAEVTAIKNQGGLWNAAWKNIQNKLFCTRDQIQHKTSVRKMYEPALRIFIKRWLRHNAALSRADIINCGLKPLDNIRTRRAKPHSAPHLFFSVISWGRLKLTFRQIDEGENTTRLGRPEGIARVEFAYSIGSNPLSPDNCTRFFSITRSPYIMVFEPEDAGKKLYIFARWVNTANQPGHWSSLHETIIP